jgi:hypothetical protein
MTGLQAGPVGERPDHERRGRESSEKDRDRRRGLRLGGVEVGLDIRQTWERHVDRQRRQDGEPGEKERKRAPVGVEAQRVMPARA